MKYTLACLAAWSFAMANPEYSCTVAGDVALSQLPKLLEVSASDRAIIEWNRFSIGANEVVRFLQPSKEATALNRVVGGDLTEIFGTLQANGIIYLVNPRGIIVGENGLIDTAAFFASTLDLSNESFLKGDELHLSGDSDASLIQLGTIRAREGDVLLFAHKIENKGLISAPAGSVSLSAGHEILLKPKESPLLNIRPDLQALGLENSGSIEALNAYLQSDSFSILALQQQGDITLTDEGGELILSSGGGPLHIDAKAHLTAPGGKINIKVAEAEDPKPLYLLGTLEADSIQIEAPKLLNAGSLTGNTISISIDDALIETTSAKHRGNTISVEAASHFSSGTYETNGENGGKIYILGDQITLAAAHLSAVGAKKGGEILVGGDFQGKNAAIRNAEKVLVTPTTKMRADGGLQGGKVIVWSEGTTENFGDISAKGATGGLIEVSGKERLIQRGEAHASGQGGQILFDPQNIVIDDVNGVYPQYQLIDPHAGSGTQFGNAVSILSNGNVVVTKPSDNFAATAAGAAYLYDGATGALISILTGSTANNSVGVGGIITLTGNPNYVIRSYNWDNGGATNAGAATWGDGVTGVTGTVSSANSLIGTTTNDRIGVIGTGTLNGIIALTNGNYVVGSSNWSRVDGGALASAGAVTWGNGTTGVTGTVSAANSLIGAAANDRIGLVGVTGVNGIVTLTNGNYVVSSSNWSTSRGAATWGNGTTGVIGAVSSANSLVGSNLNDRVGFIAANTNGVSALTNGNYVVASPTWSLGGAAVGAATWGNGTTGITGAVSGSNSLIGTSGRADNVGIGSITALTNGNYVVKSRLWNGSIGAATWGDGTTGIIGVVSSANSLVGSAATDLVGTNVVALTNGNYVVCSNQWNGTGTDLGASTWGNGTTGITGVVSTGNSLVGTTDGDTVGGTAVALTNGNYVVVSPLWNNGTPGAQVGAVTWANGTTGIVGTVSSSNSLIGSNTGDSVGSAQGVVALPNGNYVVGSSLWNGNRGAATWGSGTAGVTGIVSSANSLVGSIVGDFVSVIGANTQGITALTNGNYVVGSSNWGSNLGAATWGNGTTGITGVISSANSLVGSTGGDRVSLVGTTASGITPLPNGNYVVGSSNWNGVGAATFANGTTGITGTISSANSLIGTTAGDAVSSNLGSQNGIVALANNDYVVTSSLWDRVDGGALANCGAVTYGSGTVGITGTVSQRNSVIGGTSASSLQNALDNTAAEGTFVARFTTENANAGAIRVGLTSPNQLTYTLAADQTITILPSFVTATLNAGTDVALFANNDITVTSPLSFNTGNLSLSAGRSILFNANVTTGGADLTVVANDTLTSGVVDADRLAGDAVITIADGISLNGGGGSISLSLLDGAGKTNSGSGDITFGMNSQLITSGSGALSVFAQENNISFDDGASIEAENGSALFMAGTSLLAVGTTPAFEMTGTGVLTLVADNLNPTSPDIGSGNIDMDLATFTSNSPIRFYTTAPDDNTFPATINGVSYTPGVTFARERYSTYYPSGIATGAFTVFYKVAGGPPEPPSPSPSPVEPVGEDFAQVRVDYARAMAESFTVWDTRAYGPFLSEDGWAPPLWTPKKLNQILPSLVNIVEE